VKLRLANGWHINSHSPGNEYAVPLSFKSLDENIIIDVTWPKGETMMSAGEQVEVCGGVVLIPIRISANENVSGSISLAVTWQACNADSCLLPETLRIPCTIVVE
jgi:DsbC/DsbD-like thiol-disulfide interchange protein